MIAAWPQRLDNDLLGLGIFPPVRSPIWTPSVRKQKSRASFPPMRIKARGKMRNAFFQCFSIRGKSFQYTRRTMDPESKPPSMSLK